MTGKCLRTLVGHTGTIPTHTFVITLHVEYQKPGVNTVKLHTYIWISGGVWSSQMANNVIVSGSTDRTLKVSNLSAVE